jgi:hypothetical protein
MTAISLAPAGLVGRTAELGALFDLAIACANAIGSGFGRAR